MEESLPRTAASGLVAAQPLQEDLSTDLGHGIDGVCNTGVGSRYRRSKRLVAGKANLGPRPKGRFRVRFATAKAGGLAACFSPATPCTQNFETLS